MSVYSYIYTHVHTHGQHWSLQQLAKDSLSSNFLDPSPPSCWHPDIWAPSGTAPLQLQAQIAVHTSRAAWDFPAPCTCMYLAPRPLHLLTGLIFVTVSTARCTPALAPGAAPGMYIWVSGLWSLALYFLHACSSPNRLNACHCLPLVLSLNIQ